MRFLLPLPSKGASWLAAVITAPPMTTLSMFQLTLYPSLSFPNANSLQGLFDNSAGLLLHAKDCLRFFLLFKPHGHLSAPACSLHHRWTIVVPPLSFSSRQFQLQGISNLPKSKALETEILRPRSSSFCSAVLLFLLHRVGERRVQICATGHSPDMLDHKFHDFLSHLVSADESKS